VVGALSLATSSQAESFALAARDPLQRSSEAFNEAARKAVPSVVAIQAEKAWPEALTAARSAESLSEASPPEALAPGGLGLGSGVIIREDGTILTSFHLIEGAARVSVLLPPEDASERLARPEAEHGPKGAAFALPRERQSSRKPAAPGLKKTQKNTPEKPLDAVIVGVDPRTDLAVLRLREVPPGRKLRALSFADSARVRVGDWAIAVGNPFGLAHSVTSGIVSAKGRARMGVFEIEDFIQTDAAINPGNSGGPLLNVHGEMIGLNAAIFSQTGSFIGIGFSIPSNLARQVAQAIIEKGRVIRGWLGAVAQELDEPLARYFGVEAGQGALIGDTVPQGPAAEAGLLPGDVILNFGGRPVLGPAQLRELVSGTRIGNSVTLTISRDGKNKRLPLQVREQPLPEGVSVLAARPSPAPSRGSPTPPEPANFGLLLKEIPAELRRLLASEGRETRGALVVGVRPGSRASSSGLMAGDIILGANREPIASASKFHRFAIKNNTRPDIVLFVQRGPGERLFVALH
jgi:serine protease Do